MVGHLRRLRQCPDLIEVATDRLVALRRVCDAAIADPSSSATQVASLAAEVRRTELSVHTLVKSLDPRNETAKSLRHVAAANQRWHPGGPG